MFHILSIEKEYSQKPQTSVSLQTLTRTGKGEFLFNENNNFDNIPPIVKTEQQYHHTYTNSNSEASHEILTQVASFIHHEMPIRLARRIIDLQKVPYLSQMPSVQSVKDIYISSFLTLINEPNPRDDDGLREALFARRLELLYERHSSVLVQMARGAYELRDVMRKGEMMKVENVGKGKNHSDPFHYHNDKEENDDDGNEQEIGKKLEFEHLHECHAFLDRFYMSRIGIRVLAGQYLALRSPHMDGYIGLICQHTSPYEIVKHAVTDAYYMCEQRYGAFPKVVIRGRLDLTFAYIPTQLHYILLELLKNAMRATVEHHGIDNPSRWPPIEVIIADGSQNEDVVIKISDEGGGIKRSDMKKIWSYLFTTADPSVQDTLVLGDDSGDHSVDAPIAGLGYGLPISKSYARYFGGDVSINSMEGYGTDAFVHLCRLGDSKEPLPV